MMKFLLWLVAKIVEWILRRRRRPAPRKGGTISRIALWLWTLIKKWLGRRRG